MQPKPNGSTHKKWFGKSKLHDPSTGQPYMTRWFLGGLRVHQMHQGDLQRDVHDHPWWFITFPLTSYVEEVLSYNPDMKRYEKTLNVVKKWRFHFRKPGYTHRILGPYLPNVPLWSMYPYNHIEKSHKTRFDKYGLQPSDMLMWTFVLRGRAKQKWGFWQVDHHSESGDWTQAKEYFEMLGVPYEEGATYSLPLNPDRVPS